MSPFFPQTALYISRTYYQHKINTIHLTILSVCPLHTLRSDIDYATAKAETTYGICGIKVWINKGELLSKDPFGSEKNQIKQGSIR